MSIFDEWKSLIPKPRTLENHQQWNVFLSYRSVNRGWALDLYDVLRSFEHKVFLDQCVLSAGDLLIDKLEESLSSSQSGVLIWSNKSKDSSWVKKEYNVMERKADQDVAFRFVPLRLDNSGLPDFAANRIFLDFSSYPDGPNGGELLKLLHAIVNEPLSEHAVRVAHELDERYKKTLAKVKAATRNGNSERLFELFNLGGPEWRITTGLACKAADGLIKLNQVAKALELLEQVEKDFTKAIRPKQLRALALARRGLEGDLNSSQEILGELFELGERDPETLGIYGRTWMDRYRISGNKNHLRTSRNYYLQAFETAQDDYYTGINAATKSLFLEEPTETELANELADQVLEIVGDNPVPGDYWQTATSAEAFLIKRGLAKAAGLYRAAISIAPEEIGSHASTWKQAKKILDVLNASPEEFSLIQLAFDHLQHS